MDNLVASVREELKQLSRGALAVEYSRQWQYRRPPDFTMTPAEMIVAILLARFDRL